MKTAIFAIALIASTSASAWYNPSTKSFVVPQAQVSSPGITTTSRANVHGGYDYSDSRGRSTGSSMKNVHGGYNYSDSRGRSAGSSMSNVFGGYDYTR